MNILALELSTEACSIAVSHGDRIVHRHEIAPRKHAEYALPWADELLKQAGLAKSDLDAIAVGKGPGAFTGVRLSIAIGQGLAFALNKPLIGISTLAVLAQGAIRQHHAGPVLAVIDARMDEIYAGRFDANGHAASVEQVIAPDLLNLEGITADWMIAGTGLQAVNGLLRSRLPDGIATDATALPDARNLLTLAQRALRDGVETRPEDVEPAYLRNKVALTIAEREAKR